MAECPEGTTMRAIPAMVCAALALFPEIVGAQSSGGSYVVAASAIAGGGATLAGGAFRLRGTIGQSSTATLNAGEYRVYGGFWPPAGSAGDRIFANGFDS
jgi:hypothetical protein